ncbi:CpaF family protein [Aquihabitans daechungensis]|uniref:CpaF family protein n=1 Tax=Aquihabitans daechungensis TaxID=1052257 RepID=UPI003BA14458
MSAVEEQIHRALVRAADGRLPGAEEIASLVREADPLRRPEQVARSVEAILAQLDGLGVLEPLLRDPEVTDVMVNGPGAVWVERRGRLIETPVQLDRSQIDLLVERIVAPLGRRADPVHALVDGRLADGSRVHVVVPPLAVDGPCITIRRFSVRPIQLDELAAPPVASLLRWAVRSRCNVVVSGATGSGKTTLLNALAADVPAGERIITVEDAAELQLSAPHVVRLESRPASSDGVREVTIRDLVRSALRMRPDRLLVGEVRGPEALDLLTAMNTGHDGSLSTVHANGVADAVRRLETLVLMAGVGLPAAAVREQLGFAIDLIAHLERSSDGTRRVVEVAEIDLADGRPTVRAVAQRDRMVAPRRVTGRRPVPAS